jgi:hypothetical protein
MDQPGVLSASVPHTSAYGSYMRRSPALAGKLDDAAMPVGGADGRGMEGTVHAWQ